MALAKHMIERLSKVSKDLGSSSWYWIPGSNGSVVGIDPEGGLEVDWTVRRAGQVLHHIVGVRHSGGGRRNRRCKQSDGGPRSNPHKSFCRRGFRLQKQKSECEGPSPLPLHCVGHFITPGMFRDSLCIAPRNRRARQEGGGTGQAGMEIAAVSDKTDRITSFNQLLCA